MLSAFYTTNSLHLSIFEDGTEYIDKTVGIDTICALITLLGIC